MAPLTSLKEVAFQEPLTLEDVTQDIVFANDSAHRVAFKVNTTAAKVYCVRPNRGLFFLQSLHLSLLYTLVLFLLGPNIFQE